MRFTSVLLTIVIAFTPVLVSAAQPQTLTVTEAVATARDGQTSSVSRTGTFSTTTEGGKRSTRATVSQGNRSASFELRGETLTLSDGYSIQTRTLVNNGAEVVRQVTATAPDGSHATATLRFNHQSGKGSAEGTDRIRAFMSASEAYGVVADAVPALLTAQKAGTASVTPSFNAKQQNIVTLDFIGCGVAVLEYIAAMIGFIAACGIPEPVQPLVCAAALIMFVAAGANLMNECGERTEEA